MITKIIAAQFAVGVRFPNGKSITWAALSDVGFATISMTQDPLGNLIIQDSAHPGKVTRVMATTVLYTLEVVVSVDKVVVAVSNPTPVAAPKVSIPPCARPKVK